MAQPPLPVRLRDLHPDAARTDIDGGDHAWGNLLTVLLSRGHSGTSSLACFVVNLQRTRHESTPPLELSPAMATQGREIRCTITSVIP